MRLEKVLAAMLAATMAAQQVVADCYPMTDMTTNQTILVCTGVDQTVVVGNRGSDADPDFEMGPRPTYPYHPANQTEQEIWCNESADRLDLPMCAKYRAEPTPIPTPTPIPNLEINMFPSPGRVTTPLDTSRRVVQSCIAGPPSRRTTEDDEVARRFADFMMPIFRDLRDLAFAYMAGMFIGAAVGPAPMTLPLEQTWGRPETLTRGGRSGQGHFGDHGADFDASRPADYAQQASAFFQRSQQQGLPTTITPQGVIRTYDSSSNTFGAYNANGTTRTFFSPTGNGQAYWDKQQGALLVRDEQSGLWICKP